MRRRNILTVLAAGIAATSLAALAVLRPWQAADVAGQPQRDLAVPRYADEYPPIRYAERRPSGRLESLRRRLQRGDFMLQGRNGRQDLERLLDALGIDPASQVLVYSKTSLSVRNVGPDTPRAIYFNDDTYVAYVQGRPFEIAAMDPDLGPVFYTLDTASEDGHGLERETLRCLRCHDSLSMSGGGVPRFIIGSGYTSDSGSLVSHEGWILTTDMTPLRSRWGGWYVTGFHGDQVHLGNIVVADAAELEDLESLRTGNLPALDGVVDTSAYMTATSDIVALMVLAHQVRVHNQITRAHYDVETAMAAGSVDGDEFAELVEAASEPLVRALLFDGETPLTAPVEGTSGFAERFAAAGPGSPDGRSLRQFDLDTRMFRYPLSYVIYSPAFDALPEPVVDQVYRRLAVLLDESRPAEAIGHLEVADRGALRELLAATKPSFAAALAR